MTVINMYILRCLLNIKTNLNHYAPASTVHNYSTRNNYQLIEPQVRLSKSKNWYNSIAIALFNRLPQETFNLTCNKFKKIAQKWLVANPFYSMDEYFQMEQINILWNYNYWHAHTDNVDSNVHVAHDSSSFYLIFYQKVTGLSQLLPYIYRYNPVFRNINKFHRLVYQICNVIFSEVHFLHFYCFVLKTGTFGAFSYISLKYAWY